jgi:hypothetical protein
VDTRFVVILLLSLLQFNGKQQLPRTMNPNKQGNAIEAEEEQKRLEQQRLDNKSRKKTLTPVVSVRMHELISARFDPEHSVYQNSGRWTTYPDGIYLEPGDDAIYVVARKPASSAREDDADELIAAATTVFGQFRRHADSICPTRNEDRLKEPAARERFEAMYQRARKAQLDVFKTELSFDDYLKRAPNCEVSGNLWGLTTRFADLDAGRGERRMLVRFSNAIVIRPFNDPEGTGNHLSLLKDSLRKDGKLIRSPLQPVDPAK